jgi:CRP-like cAMP-binding protein
MLNGTNCLLSTSLASAMMARRYNRGHIFYMPGDPGDTIFLLKAGRVQQYHLSLAGRKLVTAVLEPGDIFGATTLARERHYLFAEALDDCVALVLDCWRARELLLRDPETIFLLIDRLIQRLGRAHEKLEALIFEPIPVRLARCLMEIAEDGVVQGYSHEDLSEFLGTYRETVTMVLNRFKEEGLIELGRRRIRLLDCQGLMRVASGENGTRFGSVTQDRVMETAEPLVAVA